MGKRKYRLCPVFSFVHHGLLRRESKAGGEAEAGQEPLMNEVN